MENFHRDLANVHGHICGNDIRRKNLGWLHFGARVLLLTLLACPTNEQAVCLM